MQKPEFSVIVCALLWLTPTVLKAKEAEAPPKRISTKYVDLANAQKIYMAPAMATLIEIPGPVTGYRIGDPESVQVFKPERPNNELTLVLKGQNPKPTNLIIRSNQKKYVIDIVPSKTIHQDLVQVLGDFGSPETTIDGAELIDSSERKKSK